jgi:hypothetical protein
MAGNRSDLVFRQVHRLFNLGSLASWLFGVAQRVANRGKVAPEVGGMGESKPQISNAEWEVMEVVWALGPSTPAEIIDRVATGREWNHRTVRTLLSRLIDKGALRREEDGLRLPRSRQPPQLRAGGGPDLSEQGVRWRRDLADRPFREGRANPA